MLQGNKYKRKFYTFFTAWCMVFVMTVGIFSEMNVVIAYAAASKCKCGVKGCKICKTGDNCAKHGNMFTMDIKCEHFTEYNLDKNKKTKMGCEKHPDYAKWGVNQIQYTYYNPASHKKGKKKWITRYLFEDGSSIALDAGNGYTLYDGSSREASVFAAMPSHQFISASINKKSQDLNTGEKIKDSGDINRRSKEQKEKEKKKGKDSGTSSSTDSSTCESRFKDDAYFDWEIPYDKKMSDLYDYSWFYDKSHLQHPEAKNMKKKADKTVAQSVFFTASEGDSVLKPQKKLQKNIVDSGYTGKFSKEKIGGKECEVYTASDGSKYVVLNMPSDMLKWGESANDKSKAVRKHTNGLFMDFIAKDGTTVHGVQFSIAVNAYEIHVELDGGEKKAKSCKTHHVSSGLGCAHLISEIKKEDWDIFHCWVMDSDKHPTIQQGISLQGPNYPTVDWFKAQGFTTDDKNPLVTVRYYTARDTADNPAKATSKDIVTKGTAPSTDNTDSKGNDTESTLQMNGFYSEDQLSSYTKLVEPELTDQVANSDKSVLTQEETEGLSDWQMNVERSKEHKGIATLINYILTVIGVLLIIWGSIFYMAYWFDMINPFVDLDLVSRLSFGRFTASHELDGSCTWSLTKHKEGRGTHQQTINSKVALFISVCAIAIGVLIISGGLYRIVRSVFYGGAVLFHQMFG